MPGPSFLKMKIQCSSNDLGKGSKICVPLTQDTFLEAEGAQWELELIKNSLKKTMWLLPCIHSLLIFAGFDIASLFNRKINSRVVWVLALQNLSKTRYKVITNTWYKVRAIHIHTRSLLLCVCPNFKVAQLNLSKFYWFHLFSSENKPQHL